MLVGPAVTWLEDAHAVRAERQGGVAEDERLLFDSRHGASQKITGRVRRRYYAAGSLPSWLGVGVSGRALWVKAGNGSVTDERVTRRPGPRPALTRLILDHDGTPQRWAGRCGL